MAYHDKELTLKDRVAIKALVYGFIQNWYDAFAVAFDGKLANLEKLKSIKTLVSRWKNNPNVIAYYNECLYLLNQDKDKAKGGESLTDGKDQGESVHTKTKGQKAVDYSNPQNQMEKLNDLVNSASDPSETLDALKVIIQTQKADRDAAREGKQVKAYLPITCNDCPLYQKAAQGVTI